MTLPESPLALNRRRMQMANQERGLFAGLEFSAVLKR
jgi:hypothetical protein